MDLCLIGQRRDETSVWQNCGCDAVDKPQLFDFGCAKICVIGLSFAG